MRLFNNWKRLEAVAEKDKKPLDAAKSTLASKTFARQIADARLSYAKKALEIVTEYANYYLTRWRSTGKIIKSKGEELTRKEVERDINQATVDLAKGDHASAKSTLDTTERDYPEAWAHCMKDKHLAAQVAEVRSH